MDVPSHEDVHEAVHGRGLANTATRSTVTARSSTLLLVPPRRTFFLVCARTVVVPTPLIHSKTCL